MPKGFWLVVKLLVAGLGVWYVLHSVTWGDQTVVDPATGESSTQPGVLTVFQNVDRMGLFFAWCWVSPMVLVQGVRWHLLLRCRDVPVKLLPTMRLTWVGQFFNICMPVGSTGGDVVRLTHAARTEGHRAVAVMSLFVDRLTGLGALVCLAALAGVFMWQDPQAGPLAKLVAGLAGCLWVGLLLYFSETFRRAVRLETWLQKVPGKPGHLARSLDAGLHGYRHQWPTLLLALGMSLGLHTMVVMGTAQAGHALGMTVPLAELFVVVPLLLVSIALPLTYQGLGVTDALAVALLVKGDGHATQEQVIGMVMALRLFQISLGLLGATAMIGGKLQLGPNAQQDQGGQTAADPNPLENA